jgi:zinc transport system substrate-binding protein
MDSRYRAKMKKSILAAVRNNRAVILSLLLFFSICLAGCQARPAATGPAGQLKVAVSIVPQATFVKAVGGDLVDVVTLIPPGGNPENYSPTPQQMEQFSGARLYFVIGVPAEKAGILPKVKDLNPDVMMVDLPALVDAVYPPRSFASGARDPHMWLSPKRVKEMVRITADHLSELDPAHKADYAQNAQSYIAQLDSLDQDIKASLAGLPNRTFIVYHPAFGYFADDYGLNMVALEEEGKEATAINLQKVIDLAKKEDIKVIFYQAEIDSKQARILAAEIGGQTEMVVPLDPDYINNMEKIAQTFARVLQH